MKCHGTDFKNKTKNEILGVKLYPNIVKQNMNFIKECIYGTLKMNTIRLECNTICLFSS